MRDFINKPAVKKTGLNRLLLVLILRAVLPAT